MGTGVMTHQDVKYAIIMIAIYGAVLGVLWLIRRRHKC